MPRRRQVATRGKARSSAAPAPPPSERIRSNGAARGVHHPDGDVLEATIGGEKLPFYVVPGKHQRVPTEGYIRQVATGAAELASSMSKYINALCREVVLLRGEVDELRTELGHAPSESMEDTQPIETQPVVEGEIIDASFGEEANAEAEEPYDPKPVSVIGNANPAGGPLDPETLPEAGPEDRARVQAELDRAKNGDPDDPKSPA